MATGLQQNTRGRYPDEAATELLVRVGLIHDRAPWLVEAPTVEGQRRLCIDPTVLVGETGAEGGGHQRVARIAAAMLDGGQPIRRGEALPSLDREHLRLVLGAVAHAGGSRWRLTLAAHAGGSRWRLTRPRIAVPLVR